MHRDRPRIPTGYGIETGTDGMLTWESVTAVIGAAELYWVATQLPKGGPHLIPIHAVAPDGIVHLAGDPDTRWARNLADNGAVQVGLDHGGFQVMIRGSARSETPDRLKFAELNERLSSKYGWNLGAEPIPVWMVHPTTVIGFEVDRFAASPTRFTFEETA